MKGHKRIFKSLDWKMRKYSRWVRRYMKRVQVVEREIGGEMEPC